MKRSTQSFLGAAAGGKNMLMKTALIPKVQPKKQPTPVILNRPTDDTIQLQLKPVKFTEKMSYR
jgi:hypothetical protein